MKRQPEKPSYKVNVKLDVETNRQAEVLCQLYGGITLDELLLRLLNETHKKLVGKLEKEGVGL